jgi:hypothetical protein
MANPHSNIITPPDFVDENTDSVVIVDGEWPDIEDIALWCKTAPKSYDLYIYQDIMLEPEWLMQSINRAKIIIVNMADSSISDLKKDLLQAPNVWYYGTGKFLANPRHLGKPLDWFINDTK